MEFLLLAQESATPHSVGTDPWTLINVLLSAIGAGLASMGAFLRWQIIMWNDRVDKDQAMREAESQARIVEDKRRTECLESLVEVSSKIVDSIQKQEARTRRVWNQAAQAIDALEQNNHPMVKDAVAQIRAAVNE